MDTYTYTYTHVERENNTCDKLLTWAFTVILLQLFCTFEIFLNKNFRAERKKTNAQVPRLISGLGCSLDICILRAPQVSLTNRIERHPDGSVVQREMGFSRTTLYGFYIQLLFPKGRKINLVW